MRPVLVIIKRPLHRVRAFCRDLRICTKRDSGRRDSNPHEHFGPTDFKSVASAIPPRPVGHSWAVAFECGGSGIVTKSADKANSPSDLPYIGQRVVEDQRCWGLVGINVSMGVRWDRSADLSGQRDGDCAGDHDDRADEPATQMQLFEDAMAQQHGEQGGDLKQGQAAGDGKFAKG